MSSNEFLVYVSAAEHDRYLGTAVLLGLCVGVYAHDAAEARIAVAAKLPEIVDRSPPAPWELVEDVLLEGFALDDADDENDSLDFCELKVEVVEDLSAGTIAKMLLAGEGEWLADQLTLLLPPKQSSEWMRQIHAATRREVVDLRLALPKLRAGETLDATAEAIGTTPDALVSALGRFLLG